MAASWKGALSFGGFPVAVTLHKPTPSSREGFKMIDPVHHKPVHQAWLDCEGDPVDREDTLKGLDVGGGEYRALTPEQTERVETEARSTVIEPSSFAPVASLPLHIATSNYVVLPDEKQPGSESSVNALWNGLRAMKAAYMAVLTIKTHDAILAVYAADDGLRALTFPFTSELAKLPTFTPEVNKAQAAMVKATVEDPKHGYEVKPFDPTEYVSGYAQRRQQVIDEVLAGVEPAKRAAPITPGDLMAALAASQAEVAKAVSKPRQKAKVKA